MELAYNGISFIIFQNKLASKCILKDTWSITIFIETFSTKVDK